MNTGSSSFRQPSPPLTDRGKSDANEESYFAAPPAVSLPKGGGAIKGMGEKFGANPVTGTGSMSVPIATSPGRSGFGPQLSLSYDSGAGNGIFGLGWTLSLPSLTRKTDKGLPRYWDGEESDVFILSGAEDLVPMLKADGTIDEISRDGYRIRKYRPRTEGSFARIERWIRVDSGETHWRSISKDNVTTLYGRTAESRLADPGDLTHIFSWLICESYDDKGNAIRYKYKSENSDGVSAAQAHEHNRTPESRSANRYLKHIYYGNRFSRLVKPELTDEDWMFEVVFDYGEHDPVNPIPGDPGGWVARNDPFSSYRAGFEVRTYRLCQRVLMFHHFPEEVAVGQDYLVRSTDFTYSYEQNLKDRRNPIYSFMLSVSQTGYRRNPAGGYNQKSLPPLEFTYSEANIDETVRDVDRASLENLPDGLDGTRYQWVDLDGEGLSGILMEQGSGWFYKRNLSPIQMVQENGKPRLEASFAPVELVASKPVYGLANGAQFHDLAGDGQLDVVTLRGAVPGFYKRTQHEGWETFAAFKSLPILDWDDPNLKFIDLNGDGHSDILITEDNCFVWYPSLAEDGFGPAERVSQPWDEEKGPRVIFADSTESIYLADMSGDGLTDIVRIRNGEVCYWSNLGYGRFGAKVTMDHAPWFDRTDFFDQRRIQLADIDGSGTTDILYLSGEGVQVYFNQSGNSWAAKHTLRYFPAIDSLASVTAIDLLGNGTACLVWSSPLPGNAQRVMRYIDLMDGQKPHLLTKTVNNLGAETVVQYAPSTKFYLQDKLAGNPWVTKLPFPVHVVERVDTLDRISGNAFVTRYAYHHGYFDGYEREFQGFGMVEQWDTEEFTAFADAARPTPTNLDQASHVPPVHTKTWFHTGVFLDRDRISNYFAGLSDDWDTGEYYREPAWSADDVEVRKRLLDDTLLPNTVLLPDGSRSAYTLTADEEREACRALRGSMLRQEIYSLDGSVKAEHPYTVLEQNFTVEILQPRGLNRHAVFFAHPREAIEHHYERNHEDPRVSHSLTLDVDPYGQVLRAVAVAYGRRQPDPSIQNAGDREEQMRLHVTYSENSFTKPFSSTDVWRTPLLSESRTYELTGLSLAPGNLRFTFSEVSNALSNATELSYEAAPSPAALEKRLIEHVRKRYRPDDLGVAKNDPLALLPLGSVESLALPGESYQQAFTSGLIGEVYGTRVTNAMLESESRYVHSEGDANWWIPSGRIFFSPGSADTAAQELAFARQHFFLPHRYRDPFHSSAQSTETSVDYDVYDLLLLETRDALGNRATAGERDASGTLTAAGNDYRVLQPRLMMDANRNRSAVAYDALGMVVGTAVMGKPLPSSSEGDSLSGFEADLTEAIVLAHLATPLADPKAVLQRASMRLIYDLFAYQRTKAQAEPQPAVVYTLARETHDSEPVLAGELKIQHSFAYSDGFGREIQRKIQAEPGPVPQRDGSGKIIVGADGHPTMTPTGVSPRWVGSGWTVFNNKGKPVRQFEPFFTDTHRFEFDVRIGISPVLFYDPVGRVVATLHPNHTWGKVVFGPWRQETWDANDVVLVADPKSDPDVGDLFARLPSAEYLPTWRTQREGGALGTDEQAAARKAAIHAATPMVVHADSLGRAFLTIAHNKLKYSDAPLAAPPREEFHRTRVIFDIEGNQREVIDAKDRVVVRYDYDMLGTRIHQLSMEAGAHWMLNDVAGKSLYSWDSRDHRFQSTYDALRRPTDVSLQEGAGAKLMIGRTVYGESQPNAEASNLRGRVIQVFDQAGVVTSDDYDFKGNVLRSQRQLAQAYSKTLDWSAAVPLDAPIYTSRTRFDALNRPIQLIAPHSDQPGFTVNIVQPTYNEANLLDQVHAWLNASAEPVGTLVTGTADLHAVTNIDYDAKGQRLLIDFGNGVRTTYTYDPLTFRMVNLLTRRATTALQNLHYTYDPVGNITHIRDDAQPTIYFNQVRVEPSADYTYDALYCLIEATGREHLGQIGAAPLPASYNDTPRVGISFAASDGNAMGRYLERYMYDVAGNFEQMKHVGSDPANPGWTRTYTYGEPSLSEPGKQSNRLTSTATGPTTPEIYSAGGNGYDAHGNMLRMPHLQELRWDFKDQLRMSRRQAMNASDADGAQHQGERTWYVYDASGQRVRKVTELAAGGIKDERIYLNGFEIFRRHGVNPLVRETLDIMDDKQRVALVETRTKGSEAGVPRQLIRYQFGNHLGSASLELDGQARIISYEEYTPYGSTSYQALRSQTETPKRYRFTGKERDEESGLYYHGARYYPSWLGRWASCDPAGMVDSTNLYSYVSNNPIALTDPTGRQEAPSDSDANSRRLAEHGLLSDTAIVSQAKAEIVANQRKADSGKPPAQAAASECKPLRTSRPTAKPADPKPQLELTAPLQSRDVEQEQRVTREAAERLTRRQEENPNPYDVITKFEPERIKKGFGEGGNIGAGVYGVAKISGTTDDTAHKLAFAADVWFALATVKAAKGSANLAVPVRPPEVSSFLPPRPSIPAAAPIALALDPTTVSGIHQVEAFQEAIHRVEQRIAADPNLAWSKLTPPEQNTASHAYFLQDAMYGKAFERLLWEELQPLGTFDYIANEKGFPKSRGDFADKPNVGYGLWYDATTFADVHRHQEKRWYSPRTVFGGYNK